MTEFVVHINGDPPEEGYWVLFVDAIGERFLVSGVDQQFRWVPITECTYARGASPDVPRPVFAVQPQKGLVVPKLQPGNGRG